MVLKEFALQDAGMLGGTQAALETGVVDEFPLSDQEILVRHLHKVVVDWVDEYQREQTPVGVVSMPTTRLPSAFAELEPYAENWCLPTEAERWDRRMASSMARDARILRRVLPPAGGGDRLLRQVPARRHRPTTH